MTKIVSFSGRRQSGKNSCANYILGTQLRSMDVCKKWTLNHNGELIVDGAIFDSNKYEEISYSTILYSFADVLKKDICIKILGLSHEQCFGTDDQKNSLTKLRWENMPGVTTEKTPQDPVDREVAGRLGKYYEKLLSGLIYHEPGFMTGRDVMQYVGSDIFRKMYSNVWIDATYRQIADDSPELAIITDCRFPEEVFKGNTNGNVVVRLTRVQFPNDTHKSEKVLDKENFDWSNFNMILDNEKMNLVEQGKASVRYLKTLGYIC